ncbi:MAG: PAS domain S-box protein [Bacteroidetes bacterium]|nr:PAS domain S-box protein [Bacteroidota bacterium]
MSHTNDRENWKLYWVVAIFVLLGVALVSVSYVGERVQVGINGYISGEAEWSKAQKQAVLELTHYVRTEDEGHYGRFRGALSVIYGDRMAREELSSENPNLARAREGFFRGANHPDEIGPMIRVFQNFRDMKEISTAIETWERADEGIDQLVALADSAQSLIREGRLSDEQTDRLNRRISEMDRNLTELEQQFSAAMSSAARRAGKMVFMATSILSTVFIVLAAFTAVSFMSGYKKSNKKLKESEQKLKNVLDHSRDVIYQITIGSDRYDYMSTSVKDMLGFSAREIMEGGPSFILERTHPDDIDRMRKKMKQLESENVEKKLVMDTEFRVKRADGSYIWVNNKRSLVRDSDGRPAAIVGNVRDISVRKRQMEKLDRSLAEKQTLLSEIHHRVKNNLAIVSSLIELQKDGVDAEVKSSFRDVQSRIKSIALIHEKLYQNTIFSEVELSVYLQELAEMISNTYRSKQKSINFTFNLENIKVEMTLAVPIGLICNELINNSFKHAFSQQESGEIAITLRTSGTNGILEVADNGMGLPDDFSLDRTGGLGVTLLNVLTDQIDGELMVKKGETTRFELMFPIGSETKKAENRSA